MTAAVLTEDQQYTFQLLLACDVSPRDAYRAATGDPAQTRERLTALDARGRSVLGEYGRQYRRTNQVPLSSQSLSAILEDLVPELVSLPDTGASRPSSLRGRRLGQPAAREER